MPLTFHPGAGAIVICDFSTGFRPPEMVKVRPVVVISPRRRVAQLMTVVPLSTTPPAREEPWHYQLSASAYPPARQPVWAKCDMVQAVGLARLDRIRMKVGGQRTYRVFHLDPAEPGSIRAAVRSALDL